MKLSDMKTLDQVVAENRQDPQFQVEWDRTAFARAVAVRVVAHRTRTGLTQRDLAKATGLTQPAIARLERGDHEPSLGTLAKLTKATGLSFDLKVADGGVDLSIRSVQHLRKRARVVRVPRGGRWVFRDTGKAAQAQEAAPTRRIAS
ncbi:helix-turn-helix domain-containing protein [Micromonospora echinofusca]|uniref:Helix-turn-helix domain-containing protein n=1 Tax=Micromonospora echinofusca TaxID=47858 RepID=A0ABS3VKJ3_MICEH|nr:helix-turn-helix domain-containing protein [Micromonospora echinofusca]MBO4205051.1 helix-turn-helix domain-containing protein [Micromonospora echinofusca]